MLFRSPRHVVLLIRSPIMTDAVWCTPTCGINYSVSHHDGCCFVHPDTWYNLFDFPIMTDAVWCTPTCGINYSVSHHDGCCFVHPGTWYNLFGSPIMTDAVWCILTRGIPYSVLSSRRMLFGASQHVVSLKCHTPSRRMPIVASRQVGQFFNAIRHHDGCRLVHPAKWDIGKFRGAFVTNADLCIPSGGSFDISLNSHL